MNDAADWTKAVREYKAEYLTFENAVIRAAYTSFGSGSLITEHPRDTYATSLFTKLTVSAKTLLDISPDPRSRSFEYAHLDFTGAAAISRLIIDTFVSLYHLGLEDCDDVESEARRLLAFWRDFRLRSKFRTAMGDDMTEHDAFHTEDLTRRLKSNACFAALPEQRQKHLLKKNDLLHTPDTTLERAGIDVEFHRGHYAYLSGHTHCDSIAFIFMDRDNRGMGQLNRADLLLLAGCLQYSTGLITQATDRFDQFIPGSESRGRSVKNFEPLRNKFPRTVSWEGTLIADLRRST